MVDPGAYSDVTFGIFDCSDTAQRSLGTVLFRLRTCAGQVALSADEFRLFTYYISFVPAESKGGTVLCDDLDDQLLRLFEMLSHR